MQFNNTSIVELIGKMIFRYSVDSGEEREASTGKSGDIRKTEPLSSTAVCVSYAGDSGTDGGIRDFTLTEMYSLEDDHFRIGIYLKYAGSSRS